MLPDHGLGVCAEATTDQEKKKKRIGEHLKTVHDKDLQGVLIKELCR